MSYLKYNGQMVVNSGKYVIKPEEGYPYPELIVGSLNAYANTVNIATQYDTFGDNAAIIDFVIKINGNPATLISWSDGGDSSITIGFTETITSGNVVTITYVPNAARWIEAPWSSPAYVLYAMDEEPVTNNT